jgi:ubiquitin carboxyl-terminal hydrolase 4/11/15
MSFDADLLAKQYAKEINTDNILGYHGEVAEAYAGLVLSMYKPDVNTSNSPRHLKNVVGKHNSLFQSYGQQDSQEFVGFMLDGLNEDLNRIQKKPSVETPDSTDEHVNNPEALRKLADECWAGYKARNDSVIVDLFAGAYKSTLVCPVCDKVSITFDPFTSLTLQLPLDNMWSKEVYFWPLNGPLIKLCVDLDKSSTIRQLKEFVAKRMRADSRLLQVSEIFKSKFYRHYIDLECASEHIAENDDIIVYELESTFTNIPASRNPGLNISDTPEWDSPLADRLLVPVFLRKPEDARNPRDCFSLPFFIILTPSEAREYDTILKKVLQKLDTLTTRDLFENVVVAPNSNHSDDHEMVSSIDDSDSSVTSKIKTTSIDGEDGLIDVSMKDSKAASTLDQKQPTSESPHDTLSKVHSRIRLPGSVIPHELRTLFEMRYFRTDAELLPNQWRSMTRYDRTDCPLVEFRGSTPPSEPSPVVLSDEYVMPGDDESVDEQNDASNTTGTNAYGKALQANLANDSDEDLPSISQLANTSFKRKHTPRASPKRQSSDTAQLASDDAPLVRLLEGLILDFEPEVDDALFGATMDSDDRGAPTWESIETFQDPELEKRRSTEASRRKQGITLEDCLKEFEREEILSENDMWYCSRCKEHRRASKKFELWQSPDILVIHLKRFSAGIRGFRDKIEVMVDFPVEGLDLTKRVADKATGKEYIYDLYAVDNHFGGLGGGHYTAFAKNFVNNVWYEYNGKSDLRLPKPG